MLLKIKTKRNAIDNAHAKAKRVAKRRSLQSRLIANICHRHKKYYRADRLSPSRGLVYREFIMDERARILVRPSHASIGC